jgi:hypothetical protein
MSPKKRLAAQPTKVETAPVRHFKPDPVAWAKAMERADGHVRRLVVLSPTEILVLRPKG